MSRPITPPIAADIIIELVDRSDRPIIFIERLNPPHGWALPGGFVDIGETVEEAAVREALEETALHVELKTFLGCYSKPDRDPRGHTVSMVYVAQARGEAEARDDAKAVLICDPDDPPAPLVFDHAKILQHYLHLREGRPLSPLYLGSR